MARHKKYLYIPGPTPVPPEVVSAMTKSIIGHRSGDFSQLYRSVVAKTQQVFQTQNDVFVLTNSGTGGLEMAIANTINPGDKVLSLVTGFFAQRFARMPEAYGAEVDILEFPWEGAIDLNVVEKKLQEKDYRAVLVTHNETSTGVVNDMAALGALVAKTDALLLVDAVSSLGGANVQTDAHHLDMVITSSQKALMLPPGLAAISVSEKAWARVEQCTSPRIYFSLTDYRKSMVKGHTPWTPAVNLLYGLETALDMILEEGLEQVFDRHRRLAQATRAGLKGMGLRLVAPDAVASPTVTAIWGPTAVDVEEFRKFIRQELGMTFAGGKGKLAGKIFRFGHMGYADEYHVISGLAAIELALAHFGHPVQLGQGVAAAQQVFLETLTEGRTQG